MGCFLGGLIYFALFLCILDVFYKKKPNILLINLDGSSEARNYSII